MTHNIIMQCGTMFTMRTNTCLTLPDSLRGRLDEYARQRGLPRSYAAQELLERALPTQRASMEPVREPKRAEVR
jgi:predicted transcriptional regulator